MLHTNALISLAGTLALLLAGGTALGLLDRRRFSLRWLLIAALLVALNDAGLTRLYGLLPDFLGGERNWLGKLLALAATLAVAALPGFGWRASGLTLRQAPGSLRAAAPVVLLYLGFFLALALAFSDQATGEEIAFQLTLPGLEEEPFYRGVLLLALGRAFAGRWRWAGIDWSWGDALSCLLFGLAHAFGFSAGSFTFEPALMLLTALPALLAVWLARRTGSVLLPVLLHNFGNAISLIV